MFFFAACLKLVTGAGIENNFADKLYAQVNDPKFWDVANARMQLMGEIQNWNITENKHDFDGELT